MMMLWLYMWIEWLIVVDDELTCQKLFMRVCCVFMKKWMNKEVMVVELWMNSWLFVVDDVLEHVVDELV